MDQSIREDISRDYKSVQASIQQVFDGTTENIPVRDPDYIRPTLYGREVPFNNPRGALVYYTNIRNALEAALITEIIPRNLARKVAKSRVPDYVKKLFGK